MERECPDNTLIAGLDSDNTHILVLLTLILLVRPQTPPLLSCPLIPSSSTMLVEKCLYSELKALPFLNQPHLQNLMFPVTVFDVPLGGSSGPQCLIMCMRELLCVSLKRKT